MRSIPVGLLLFSLAAEANEAVDLIGRMSARYREMLPAVRMEADVRKKVSQGDFAKESTRRFRVYVAGEELRVDLLGDGGEPAIVRVKQGGRLVLFSAVHGSYSDQGEGEAGTEDTEAVVRQYRITFFDRFLHLSRASPRVVSFKPAKLKAGGATRECLSVEIRAPEGSEVKWTGRVWIEKATALVWRAQMSARDEFNQFVDEDVSWREIVAGPAAVGGELPWSPPAGAVRIPRWTHTLPR